MAELRSWVFDPSFVNEWVQGNGVRPLQDIPRNISEIGVLNGLRLADFVRAQEGRVWAMATNIGLVRQEDLDALGPTANAVVSGLANAIVASPGALAEEVASKVGLMFFRVLSALPVPNASYQLAMQLIGAGLTIFQTLQAAAQGRPRERLPLQFADDKLVADEGRVKTISSELAGRKDWSRFFAPAFTGTWRILELGAPGSWDGKEAAYGSGNGMGFGFVQGLPGDQATATGGFGFVPGTARALDMLQHPLRWQSARDFEERDNSTRWASYYCKATDDPCGQGPDAFSGKTDCRQCVQVDSVRGTSRGDWRDNAGLWSAGGLGSGRVLNVGDYLPNSTQALAALWDSLTPTNPASACVDAEGLFELWKAAIEGVWERAPSLWAQHDSYAWRALVSSFLSSFLVSREDGRLGGAGTALDWRQQKWGGVEGLYVDPSERPPVLPLYSDGIRFAPVGSPKWGGELTPFVWKDSVFRQIIGPALARLGQVQDRIYKTSMVCYLWQRQGAHWNEGSGKLRKNWAGKAYEEGLRAVLDSPSLVARVAMQHVVDPEIRNMLIAKGAKPIQTGGTILAPDFDRPGRGFDPITPLGDSVPPAPDPLPPQGGLPGDPEQLVPGLNILIDGGSSSGSGSATSTSVPPPIRDPESPSWAWLWWVLGLGAAGAGGYAVYRRQQAAQSKVAMQAAITASSRGGKRRG